MLSAALTASAVPGTPSTAAAPRTLVKNRMDSPRLVWRGRSRTSRRPAKGAPEPGPPAVRLSDGLSDLGRARDRRLDRLGCCRNHRGRIDGERHLTDTARPGAIRSRADAQTHVLFGPDLVRAEGI